MQSIVTKYHGATNTRPSKITAKSASGMSALKFHSEDNGNCRVYFTRGKLLYCWQAGIARGAFEFLRCSRDGEPSHEVHGFTDSGKTAREETPAFAAETSTGRELSAFLSTIATP